MPSPFDDLQKRIDVKIVEAHEREERRGHLGASQIGHNCYRYLWHVLHWSYKEKFTAKQLRLFERGNLEESRIVKWLRSVCDEVLDVNPKTGKQWRIHDFNDIFSGSCDCVIKYKGVWALAEFKTHGDKSFKELIKLKSVKASKPVHYAQMQVYMRKLKLNQAVYIAINKNTDEMYFEVVEIDLLESDIQLSKAEAVVYAESGLDMPKISESPIWWECKPGMCTYHHLCHKGAMPDSNCRTCHYSKPLQGKVWYCNKHQKELETLEEQLAACDDYRPADVFPQDEKPVKLSLK
ncbi:Cas4-domain exonuclease [Salmonella phage SPLA2]|nr:Cas4-domain exonuclease [Salmonella phage SPLA2]